VTATAEFARRANKTPMPQRSNLLQRIVVALYEALKPTGGTVTESALLLEPSSGTPREVDILAETSAYGVVIRIAIEVRDRSRREGVEWIDGLIGKFGDIKVDRKIAIARSGFTAAATAKAESAGITTLSATEAELVKWPLEFQRLGVATIVATTHVDVTIRTDPKGCRDLARDSKVYVGDGTDGGTLGEFIEMLADLHRQKLKLMLSKRFLDYYKTLDDLKKKLLVADELIEPPVPTFVETAGCGRVRIALLGVRSRSANLVKDVPVRHTRIGDALITSSEVEKNDGAKLELFSVQRAVDPGRAFVRISQPPGKVKKRP
jgi:hypothetical protein